MTENLIVHQIDRDNPTIELHEYSSQQLALMAFERAVRTAYDNPFVTAQSREKRVSLFNKLYPSDKKLRYEPENLWDHSGNRLVKAHPFFPVAFVFGSVARGQASRSSDTDALVIHEARDFIELHPDLISLQIRELPSRGNNINIGYLAEDSYLPPASLLIFCPAIGEFEDDVDYCPEIKESAFLLRQKMVRAINIPPPSLTSEEMWEVFRQRLNGLVLPSPATGSQLNSQNEVGRTINNRVEKIESFRNGAIDSASPDSSLQRRIRSFFSGHDELSYPDWNTMKLAFGVN